MTESTEKRVIQFDRVDKVTRLHYAPGASFEDILSPVAVTTTDYTYPEGSSIPSEVKTKTRILGDDVTVLS